MEVEETLETLLLLCSLGWSGSVLWCHMHVAVALGAVYSVRMVEDGVASDAVDSIIVLVTWRVQDEAVLK